MSKVWLVTGSSRGFGRSIAEAVLAKGDKLVATARNLKSLEELVERYGDNILAYSLDVTDPQQAEKAVQAALDRFGRIDVLVNNAGYGNISSIEQTTMEDFRSQIETNFWGVVNVTKAALPVLRKQKSGHILQFSSIGGRGGAPGLAAYQSAKWAVEGFSEVLAKEVTPLGIKVTLVEPGGFRTDWAGSSMEHVEPMDDYKETVGSVLSYTRETSGHQPGDPDKAAQAIIQITEVPSPPLRLLLGSDAVQIAKQIDQLKLAETERWEELSRSTDFEDKKLDQEVLDFLNMEQV